MQTLWQDFRYAVRMLFKKPAVTIMAILTLAIGIGANTAIFSVVNGVLLRPLPYKDPDRLAMVWMDNSRINVSEDWHSYPNYVDYRTQTQTFEDIAMFNNMSLNLTGEGEPERIVGAHVSSNLFPLLGVEAALGRTFTAEEDVDGKDKVVLLGYGLWQRRFAGDKDILGKSIYLSGEPRVVVGVMPKGFAFPRKETDMWIPSAPGERTKQARGSFWIQLIGRLKPGVTVKQAQADMSTIAANIRQQNPDQEGYDVNIVSYHEQVVGNVKPALLVLLGAVAFVLLISCVNVANLLLARAAGREREIAIRTAIGATRARLIRQLLTESALLAALGGAAGILLAVWGLDALIALSPQDIPRLDQIRIDGRVLGFSLAVSILTGLIFGLVPALQGSKSDLNESLKDGGRGATTGIRGRRLRNILVVAEIAIALVLLIGAGLMIRSFLTLQKVNLGFNPDNILTLRVRLSGSKYREGAAAVDFYKQLLQRVSAMPGVQSAGAVSDVFLSKTPNSGNFSIEGRPDFPPAERVEVPIDVASPNYFKAMEIPLLEGRFFDDRDSPDGPPVVIINETMARLFWPGEDALGKRIKYGQQSSEDSWKEIIGIVKDTRRTGFDAEVRPETYLPHAQAPARGLMLIVRGVSDPLNLATTIRAAVLELDKDQPVYEIKTMDMLLGDMVAQRRLNTLLFGIFAVVAMLLASVGIYGIMSQSVTQRTHEIGVRMALGAQKSDVLGLVLRQAMTLAVSGIVLGLGAAFALTRVMSSLLYGVSATDPLTFAAISLALAGVAMLASYIPARRAAKVDPMVALRYE